MKIFYSKTTNGFYVEASSFIPDYVIEITKEKHNELMSKQSEGLSIVADKNGNPINVEPPKKSSQYYVYDGEKWVIPLEHQEAFEAEQKAEFDTIKKYLLSEAKEKIEVLQDTIDLGRGDDSTKALLKNWKLYRVLLNEIKDLTQENITWPVKPE